MTDFRLWPSLPEGPLLRVFEMVYEGPRGRLEVREASLLLQHTTEWPTFCCRVLPSTLVKVSANSPCS